MFTHNFVTCPEVKQINLNGNRTYETPDGKSYESVTKYINRLWDKSFLEKWKKRIGEKKAASESKRATDRGMFLHKTTEAYIMNNDTEVRKLKDENLLYKELFLKIRPHLDKIDNVRLLEKAIYSDELKLAGTPDIIADYEGVLSTVDLKTSGKDKLEEYITTYWLQCSIYSLMFNERFGIMPSQSVIIMAVEENPYPAIFVESTFKGQMRLNSFIEDPVAFQERLEAEKKLRKVKK